MSHLGPVEVVRPFATEPAAQPPHFETFPVVGALTTAVAAPGTILVDTAIVNQHTEGLIPEVTIGDTTLPFETPAGAEGAVDLLGGGMTLGALMVAYLTWRQYKQHRAYQKWFKGLLSQSSTTPSA